MLISPPLAEVLAAGRRQFNQRVEETRRRTPGFDAADFASFLQHQLDPLVSAVHTVAPARTAAVALAAYDIALVLCAQGLAGPGARLPLLNNAWRTLLPQLASLIAEQPHDLLGALSNAAVHLGTVEGARPAEWMERMARLGPGCDTPAQLLALGKVLAWRAGLAHFRTGALQAASALPEPLQREALRAPEGTALDVWRRTLEATPWAGPVPRPDGWTVGDFTGFGGRFATPPELRVCAAGLLVRSGGRHFLAVADACGAVLMAASAQEFDQGQTPQRPASVRLRGSTLLLTGRELALDLPEDGLVLAGTAHTLAIASPYSHALRLVPL